MIGALIWEVNESGSNVIARLGSLVHVDRRLFLKVDSDEGRINGLVPVPVGLVIIRYARFHGKTCGDANQRSLSLGGGK